MGTERGAVGGAWQQAIAFDAREALLTNFRRGARTKGMLWSEALQIAYPCMGYFVVK